MNEILNNVYAIFPELVLAVGAMWLMLAGVFRKQQAEIAAFTISAYGALLFIALAIYALITISMSNMDGLYFNNLIVFDDFAVFTKLLILSAGLLILWASIGFCQRNHQNFPFEYSILVLLSLCGMLIMTSSADFLSLYLGLEMQSLALYVLAAIDRRSAKSSEAAVKYFVLGALASGILLYGVSLIYGFAGSTNFNDLAVTLADETVLPKGLIVGLVMVLVGLAFKISAAPFHMWTPDVYEGSPTPVTAYFAIVPKLAVAVLLARVLTGAFEAFAMQWQDIIIIISVLSMTVGAFAGVFQKNFKRLIAYSSIANMGYALIGIAAYANNGISATLVFFTIYMLVSIGIFALIMSIQVNGNSGLEKIEHLNGLAKSQPIFAALLGLMMFSMIGLPFPPFAGFFGKFFVFKSAVDAGLYGLAVIGVVSSVVAAFYYLRIVKVMYFDKLAEGTKIEVHLTRATKAVLAIVIIANAIIFFQPHKLLDKVPAVQLGYSEDKNLEMNSKSI